MMGSLDWTILVIYILLIISMSWWIGKRQKSQYDYYLGGRRMGSWPIALSIMATQVSAISLIGAPAFVALRSGGGLTWLWWNVFGFVGTFMVGYFWSLVGLEKRKVPEGCDYYFSMSKIMGTIRTNINFYVLLVVFILILAFSYAIEWHLKGALHP